MSSTSIDDLLAFEEEAAPVGPQARPSRWRPVLRSLAWAAALVAVLLVGLRAVGLQVSLPVLIAGVLAVLAVRRVTALLAPPPPPPPARQAGAGEDDGSYNWGARDALRGAINQWERPLDWSANRTERFTEVVLPRIGELADERMRLKHGVTRESDPARARVLLGDRLWTFLETPPRRTPSPRDLAVIVAELESI
ncbi:hypothetical protein GAR06_05337 [Micromonospora saelicesensis]|uniref:DUF4129 domain-containing protein n=1 Tax=Micromonospora saelicesensis TaxID=285676 RepID=A0ABX9CE36_9ACTN|nr:hypothetical protein [Micromonospora saelicesensis]RAN95174.1 hypothetical protein GAR05_04437 [Micromonospora saelicesensis]RAO42157.1 hypothetical protein GAR06_05337 [Micromonospora saelicesensis]RAO60362.1 hypothetical protein PSN01_02192 [Micromonospora saelicesensis]